MVISPFMAMVVAVTMGGIVAVAEWMHARRMRRIARLAFGMEGRPAAWVALVPVSRVAAVGMLTWGLLMLAVLDPEVRSMDKPEGASKHLLVALDVSPSMMLEDSGPEREKVMRSIWGGKVVQGILDRLDMATTRISLVAFYTDAITVLKETHDKSVIANALDGLPMYVAFESGPTKVQEGVASALDMAKGWMPESATLVVLSDGDTLSSSAPTMRLPASIADVIVIGVGDPHRSMSISGHSSRQDVTSLKQLATRLGGYYHQGNEKHLPSKVMNGLTMIEPRLADDTGLRELALILCGVGALVLAGIAPALSLLGRPRGFARERRQGLVSGGVA
ncbi:MAG: VWA domain-containing protein [Phycisphaerales bacterium]|nr:VWA domain-containing protein [Phycisphaerales bacterium]